MNEQDILKQIMRHAPTLGARLFRNNVGTAWMGKSIRRPDGTVIIRHARRVQFGIPGPGGSDLIGWVQRGNVAHFVAVETKTPTGRARANQLNFLKAVHNMGGVSGICRSVGDLEALLG